jgi:ABC-type phosphate/phosphonate transport system substrate-binding protein
MRKARRLLLALLLAGGTHAALAQEIVLAINEGTTYLDAGPVSERYRALTDLLSKELKRPVRAKSVDRYADFEQGLATEKYELVFIHPAHIGLAAVKSGKYVGLASAAGYTDYRARVMVKKDSPLKSLADLRGKKVGVPALESITTVMFAASQKELGLAQPEKYYTATRYQDAVPFMVENGFVEAGVTGSAAVAKAWAEKGGRVLGETKPVAIKQFLASRKLSEEERSKVQALLLKLADGERGQDALKPTNIKGFVAWNEASMSEATKRLGL